MIELFAVTPEEDETFLAAWAAAAPPGASLYRALRDDVQLRYASLDIGPGDGVLLIVAFDVGEDDRFNAAWEPVRDTFATRRGFIGARLDRDRDGRAVAVVHWSSPLMYARTVREHGDVIAAMPFAAQPALYLGVTFVQDRPGTAA